MNKTLIIVLAVCIISAQAFVKRDAPAEPSKGLNFEDINKQIEEFTKNAQQKIQETFSSDNIQKTITEVQTNINKMLEDVKKTASTASKP